MNNVAIKVHNVNKSFKLPHEKQGSIKSMFVNIFSANKTYEKQQVLKDISFEIKKGEFFGIVGRNGSGKSTLLKLLAGVYSPNSGHIHINGKLTPFIELGVGFNPELTGRENVYLNGALLGFSRKEMDELYEEIVSFAELERFMDQKLKNYSSGMQVRLAFSIAIRAESEILVLDEVLAVGDAAFQKKCLQVFNNYKATKRTIVLVTHEMDIVKKFCNKALLISDGKIQKIGDPDLIADEYRKINEFEVEKFAKEENRKRVSGYRTKILPMSKTRQVQSDDEVAISIDYSWASGKVKGAGVALHRSTGEYIFGANTFLDNVTLKDDKLVYRLVPKLGAGEYFFKVAVFGKDDKEVLEYIDKGPSFEVVSRKQKWEGLVNLDHHWK